MAVICESDVWLLLLVIVFTLNFESLLCAETPEDINKICEISNERFPDEQHNVSAILQTYEDCFHQLQLGEYTEKTKEGLLKQLVNRLDCFREDLKQAYYAGNIDYRDMEQVDNLIAAMQSDSKDEVIVRYRKDKSNCNYARIARSTVKHIIPLVVTGTITEKQKACDAIFRKGDNITQEEIPTPKLDTDKDSKELTVPLPNPTTYRIDSPEAEEALTRYYKVVMKCLTLTTQHKIQIFKFNRRFYDWLNQSVLPYLKEDKCYPAFGGVLRIVETMRQNDFVPKNATCNFIFYRQKDLDREEEEKRKKEDNATKIISHQYFLLILIPWLVFVIIIIAFVLWRTGHCCPGSREKEDGSETPSTTEIFYYPIDDDAASVSLQLDDDVTSEPPYESEVKHGTNGYSPSVVSKGSVRQRGGVDFPYDFYYYCEDRKTTFTLPLKRHLTHKTSSSSFQALPSPGKRPKTITSK